MACKISPDGKILLTMLSYDSVRNGCSRDALTCAKRYGRCIPKGEKPQVFVGTGSCSLGAGADRTLKEIRRYAEKSPVHFLITETGCGGLCSEEPVIQTAIPGRARLVFGRVTEDVTAQIMDSVFVNGKPDKRHLIGQVYSGEPDILPWEDVPNIKDHPFFKGQTRRTLSGCGLVDPLSIDTFLALGGYKAFAAALHTKTPGEVRKEIEQSGLRGLGGAFFPVAEKLNRTARCASEHKYLICNADEGDPGSTGGRILLEGNPHQVLEGLAIAAYAVGATDVCICIRCEYRQAVRNLETALEQARTYGIIGSNVLDSGFDLNIMMRTGAGAFVSGEETALIRTFEGERGTPSPRPPYPSEYGINGCPTAICSVETLANLPFIIREGAEKFRESGVDSEYGTKIITLSGNFIHRGTLEVAFGTPLDYIIENMGGGPGNGSPIKMIQIGGPAGAFLPADNLHVKLTQKSIRELGAAIGSGGILAFDEKQCIVDAVCGSMDFLRNESCGKCVPCREGINMLWHILDSLTHGRNHEQPGTSLKRFQGALMLRNLAEVLQDSSLCRLGKSAAMPVLSAMRYFQDEFETHLFDRKCPAGYCKELAVYMIDRDLCIGCGICARECPAEAISGKKHSPYFIETDKCTGCGICREKCRFKAVKMLPE